MIASCSNEKFILYLTSKGDIYYICNGKCSFLKSTTVTATPHLFKLIHPTSLIFCLVQADVIMMFNEDQVKEHKVGRFLKCFHILDTFYLVNEKLSLSTYNVAKVTETGIQLREIPRDLYLMKDVIVATNYVKESLVLTFHHVKSNVSHHKIILPSSSITIQEKECILTLNPTNSEIFEIVPNSTRKIFTLGSEEPCAIYYEAYLENHVPNMSLVNQNLADSLIECLDASKYDYIDALVSSVTQGNLYLEKRIPDLSMTVNKIKILQHLWKQGIWVSFASFESVSLEKFLGFLNARRLFALSDQVCRFLHGNLHKWVLVPWACQKVMTQESEDVIFDSINHIHDPRVIEQAFFIGKRALAVRLLKNDGYAINDKILLYLHMRENQMAMQTALDTLDPNIFTFLLEKMQIQDLFTLFEDTKYEPLKALFLLNRTNAKQYFSFCKDYKSLGLYEYSVENVEAALELLKQGKQPFESSICEEYGKMRKVSKKKTFVDFLMYLLQNHMESKFMTWNSGISTKKQNWIRLRVFLQRKQFGLLDELNLDTSQIEHILGEVTDPLIAQKWIPKVSDSLTRVDLYWKFKLLQEAIQTAFESKNKEILEHLLNNVTTEGDRRKIQDLLKRL